jgi:hypothetical protein
MSQNIVNTSKKKETSESHSCGSNVPNLDTENTSGGDIWQTDQGTVV